MCRSPSLLFRFVVSWNALWMPISTFSPMKRKKNFLFRLLFVFIKTLSTVSSGTVFAVCRFKILDSSGAARLCQTTIKSFFFRAKVETRFSLSDVHSTCTFFIFYFVANCDCEAFVINSTEFLVSIRFSACYQQQSQTHVHLFFDKRLETRALSNIYRLAICENKVGLAEKIKHRARCLKTLFALQSFIDKWNRELCVFGILFTNKKSRPWSFSMSQRRYAGKREEIGENFKRKQEEKKTTWKRKRTNLDWKLVKKYV